MHQMTLEPRSQPGDGEERSAAESDERLMVRLMEGDADAFEPLYDRYCARIQTFVARFVGDRQWAEDLTHEIFLKVYRNPSAFDPRKRFLTWLFAVARNACIDFLRLKRLPTLPMGGRPGEDRGPTHEPESPRSGGPVSLALGAEMEEKLQLVLATLSPKLREVFLLCALQGLSYEEAAAVIGCPTKTVSSRLSRARDRIHAGFTKLYPDESLER